MALKSNIGLTVADVNYDRLHNTKMTVKGLRTNSSQFEVSLEWHWYRQPVAGGEKVFASPEEVDNRSVVRWGTSDIEALAGQAAQEGDVAFAQLVQTTMYYVQLMQAAIATKYRNDECGTVEVVV